MQDVRGPLKWVDKDFLAEQRATHPDSVYRRLHLNEWCASEDRLTNLDDVRACVTLDGPLDRAEGHRVQLALDLGVRHDRTVAALMRSERMTEPSRARRRPALPLGPHGGIGRTRHEPSGPRSGRAVGRIHPRAYRAKVVCDPWQAIAMVQRLRSRGLQVEEFTFSQQSVGRLADGLHNVIRDNRWPSPTTPNSSTSW